MMKFYNQTATIAAAILLSATTLFGMSSDPEAIVNGDRKITDRLSPSTQESFQYEKGFKDGYEEGKRRGYRMAQQDAMRSIERYKKLIEGYESGKYISRKGKVTPPRIYQTRKNGKVSIVVKGCEVRGKLTPQEILMLPEYDGTPDGDIASEDFSRVSDDTPVSNSVFIPGVEARQPVAKAPSTLKKKTTIVLRDTRFYRNLLSESGVLYRIQPNGGGLRATFSSPQESRRFIKDNNLIKGKDYL